MAGDQASCLFSQYWEGWARRITGIWRPTWANPGWVTAWNTASNDKQTKGQSRNSRFSCTHKGKHGREGPLRFFPGPQLHGQHVERFCWSHSWMWTWKTRSREGLGSDWTAFSHCGKVPEVSSFSGGEIFLDSDLLHSSLTWINLGGAECVEETTKQRRRGRGPVYHIPMRIYSI